MAKIHLGGAGGAPTNNVIRSLRESGRGDKLIGTSTIASDLALADVDERHVVPPAATSAYPEALLRLLERTRPDFVHVQNDIEVLAVSRMRDEITDRGIKLFLPDSETVEICVNKFRSYECWRTARVLVPDSIMLYEPSDLRSFTEKHDGRVWLRAVVGGGGRGALPVDDIEFACDWVTRFDGWGTFMAAERLTDRTVTWLSIWDQGELIVAQTRARLSWGFANRTLSGVTGITGVGVTVRDAAVDDVARRAIAAIDPKPHGIFGVDMTYDEAGTPNPTEINIGRFFTTVHFFTEAGVNFPTIYRDLALGDPVSPIEPRINPLTPGLAWVRGMDVLPVLTTVEYLESIDHA